MAIDRRLSILLTRRKRSTGSRPSIVGITVAGRRFRSPYLDWISVGHRSWSGGRQPVDIRAGIGRLSTWHRQSISKCFDNFDKNRPIVVLSKFHVWLISRFLPGVSMPWHRTRRPGPRWAGMICDCGIIKYYVIFKEPKCKCYRPRK